MKKKGKGRLEGKVVRGESVEKKCGESEFLLGVIVSLLNNE